MIPGILCSSSLKRIRKCRLAFPQLCELRKYVNPTIYAMSTAPGRAALSVFRISGPGSRQIYELICPKQKLPSPRKAVLRTFRDPQSGQILDRGLVTFFRGPASYTGEDLVELHVHGGIAVQRAILRSLGEASGLAGRCRLAEPGEFSYRAFENRKMDLTQAEGLADVINAQTEQQRRVAVKQAGGHLEKLYASWRDDIIQCWSLVEAIIDFEEQDQIDPIVLGKVQTRVQSLIARLNEHLSSSMKGEVLRQGIRMAILGPPNAGKSSLLNLLAKRSASIVSSEAGTTRDVVEVALDIGGLPLLVSDTAGIRIANGIGSIEQEGIRRAKEQISMAHVVLYLFPAGVDESTLREFDYGELNPDTKTIVLLNKIDLERRPASDSTLVSLLPFKPDLSSEVSCLQGTNIHEFIEKLRMVLQDIVGIDNTEEAIGTNERQRLHTSNAIANLKKFSECANDDIVVAAEYLRSASDDLGRVSGHIDIEEVLGSIFSQFCIGK